MSPEDARFIPSLLTRNPYGWGDTDISLVDIATIMTGFGLPTEARTLLVTIKKVANDRSHLLVGDQVSIDCLIYLFDGATYIDTLIDNLVIRADFDTRLNQESELPYTRGLAVITVLPFASTYQDAGFAATHYNVGSIIKLELLNPYVAGQQLTDEAKKYPDPHQLVHSFIQLYGIRDLDIFSHWDDERFGPKERVSPGSLAKDNAQTNLRILDIIDLVRPELHPRIEVMELKYPAVTVTLGVHSIFVRGSAFRYKASVLIYQVNGEEVSHLLVPADMSRPVEFFVQGD